MFGTKNKTETCENQIPTRPSCKMEAKLKNALLPCKSRHTVFNN